jgi:hypothetical protein
VHPYHIISFAEQKPVAGWKEEGQAHCAAPRDGLRQPAINAVLPTVAEQQPEAQEPEAQPPAEPQQEQPVSEPQDMEDDEEEPHLTQEYNDSSQEEMGALCFFLASSTRPTHPRRRNTPFRKMSRAKCSLSMCLGSGLYHLATWLEGADRTTFGFFVRPTPAPGTIIDHSNLDWRRSVCTLLQSRGRGGSAAARARIEKHSWRRTSSIIIRSY